MTIRGLACTALAGLATILCACGGESPAKAPTPAKATGAAPAHDGAIAKPGDASPSNTLLRLLARGAADAPAPVPAPTPGSSDDKASTTDRIPKAGMTAKGPVGLWFMTRYMPSLHTLEKSAWYFSPDGVAYEHVVHGLSVEDLAAFRAHHREPLQIPYRGGKVFATPELTAGPTLASTLRRLQESLPLSSGRPPRTQPRTSSAGATRSILTPSSPPARPGD